MLDRGAALLLPDRARIALFFLKGGLGDCVLGTAALRSLRETYPCATIDLFAASSFFDLLNQEVHWFDEIYTVPLPRLRQSSPVQKFVPLTADEEREQEHIFACLRERTYDALLLCDHFLSDQRLRVLRLLTRAPQARWRIGFQLPALLDILDLALPAQGYGTLHEAEYYIAIVEAVGARVREKRLFFPINAEQKRLAHAWLQSNIDQAQRPLVALHPGCNAWNLARRWMPERYAQVVDQLYREVGGQALLLGGPEEAQLREEVRCALRSAVPCQSLSGQESVMFTAALIEQCDLFIGNDSALVHIAASVNTPTLAVFGLTNHRAFGPYMPETPARCAVARLDLPCMPCCFDYGIGNIEGCATRDCLTRLPGSTVVALARQLLRASAKQL